MMMVIFIVMMMGMEILDPPAMIPVAPAAMTTIFS
jgi:hypothetical protein